MGTSLGRRAGAAVAVSSLLPEDRLLLLLLRTRQSPLAACAAAVAGSSFSAICAASAFQVRGLCAIVRARASLVGRRPTYSICWYTRVPASARADETVVAACVENQPVSCTKKRFVLPQIRG